MNDQILKSIRDSIDSAVNPRLTIPRHDIEAAAQPSHATIRAIARELGFTVPKSIIAEITELDNRFMAVVSQLEKNTSRAALEDFRNHSQARDEKILASEDVSHHTGQTLEDFQRVAREKLDATKRLMKRHGAQTFEIVRPYLQKFADLVLALADQRAAREIELCDRYGFPWKASDAVLRLYRASQCVENRLKNFNVTSGERPKVIADFIFNIAE
ncbi:MAG: hypothetical protein PHY43_14830 [Verrucomicrobiales bacterium]|nr:hypothetical protein [Verrucomicrobiales bacterium]